MIRIVPIVLLFCASCFVNAATPTTIRVDARGPGRLVSPWLTGACIEDVNHEIYGGIYSQMIFGESFQEPPAATSPLKGFVAHGGDWRSAEAGIADGSGGDGPKLVSSAAAPFADGAAGVDVFLPGNAGGNAGLIVRVARAGEGADRFDGYEVALDAGRQRVRLGRHRQNFDLLAEAEHAVPVEKWIALSVRLSGKTVDISVDGRSVVRFDDPRPLGAGAVGLRQWQRSARYRNLWVKPADGARADLSFDPAPSSLVAVSGMWAPMTTGGATLHASIERDRPFAGAQSQRITFAGGSGDVGVENRGLNRAGMAFVAGKAYEGYVWLRAEKPIEATAAVENADGTRTYARTTIAVVGGDEWKRYEFTLTPDAADERGRFAIRLTSPGSLVIGHAFLQPGEWGRYKSLPVRKDVVDGLVDQGITMLRYGGSMVNIGTYRWKNMLGPRDRRPPYRGHWYPYSTNGWGIVDFLNLCEAAGFAAIPTFSADESPQDMADFVEYVNGGPGTEWGKRRAADGHPQPYKLRYLQLGNEEKVDESYWRKFERVAPAVWAKDPEIVLVVGDFQFERPITDPSRVEGAASGITSLDAHRKILALAKANDREVWFDVHMWTDGPTRSPSASAFTSFVDAIEKLADGAKHKVVVFEFNANNHEHRRALANADGIGRMIRDGRVPVVLSANCLQVDGHNDNGWDQGLLFLNGSKVWLQPPGYVTRMVARNYLPRVVDARVEPAIDDSSMTVTATRAEDGKRLVLQIVNLTDEPRAVRLELNGFSPASPAAAVETLAAPLDARNTAAEPSRVVPQQSDWRHGLGTPAPAEFTVPARSFSVIRFE